MEPADDMRVFACTSIDVGADMFVGHGSHTTLGFEIYETGGQARGVEDRKATAWPRRLELGARAINSDLPPSSRPWRRTGSNRFAPHAGTWPRLLISGRRPQANVRGSMC